MMKRISLLVVFAWVALSATQAQDAAKDAPIPDGWRKGAGLGLDLSALLLNNPKIGSGDSRLGVGGNATIFMNYKKGRTAWDNNGTLLLGVQRIGIGFLPGQINRNIEVPWQKNADELRFNSKVGYKTSEASKFFYAADLTFLSQLIKSYGDNAEYAKSKGNFVKDVFNTNTVLSKFLSPAFVTLSAGIDYKVNSKLSVYYSPLAARWIIVADDEIAMREAVDKNGVGLGASVFGNDWKREGNVVTFKNARSSFGSLLKGVYNDKYLNDRITYTSQLNLFTDYLNQPFGEIAVDWANSLGFNIYKGLQLAAAINLFYDDNVFVQISDANAPGGVSGLGKRVSTTSQILLKYNIVF